MHYRERKKVVKTIEFHKPRKETILFIKRQLGYTTAYAREFYDKTVSGEFVGSDYEDIEHIGYLNTFGDWLTLEFEEAPLSKEELEEQEKLNAAEAWRDSLSPEDRAHHDLLMSRFPICVAAS